MTDKLKVNVESFTLGDMVDFEEVSGSTFTSAFSGVGKDGMDIPAKNYLALVYVLKRKENPEFTLADARALGIQDLDFGGAEDPKE